MKKLTVLTVVFFFAAAEVLLAQYEEKKFPSIAVMPLINNMKEPAKLKDDIFKPKNITKELTRYLRNDLKSTGKFKVSEDDYIQMETLEQDITPALYGDTGRMKQFGTYIEVDYLLMATILEVRFNRDIIAVGETMKMDISQIGVIYYGFSLFDVKKADYIKQKELTCRLDLSSLPKSRTANMTMTQFKDLLLKQLARQNVDDIVRAVFPVYIKKVTEKEIFINRGSNFNIKVGDRYLVYPKRKRSDPQADISKPIALIQVRKVNADDSEAAQTSKPLPDLPIEKGCKCELYTK